MHDHLRELRDQAVQEFLDKHGFLGCGHHVIAGDASFRRYERVIKGDSSYILMDAPAPMEDIRPFVKITTALIAMDSPLIIAPEIIASDTDMGFLLLSDFGSVDLKSYVTSAPLQEATIYRQAVDILIALHQAEISIDIPNYGRALYSRELGLFSQWFIPAITGDFSLSDAFDQACMPAIDALLNDPQTPVLVLRDYHAENMMCLSGDRLGQLDYQDAVMGHPAYDLVSLLQDARRVVSPALEQELLSHYIQATAVDEVSFRRAYAILGAQRAIKIIGIFFRLYLRDSKQEYLKYIPHMWDMLERNFHEPLLHPLHDYLDGYFPKEMRRQIPDADKIRAKFPVPSHAMIMAAGMGSRMGEISDHTPKPLVTVADKGLLSRALDHAFNAGVQTAVVNVHHHADQIEQACQARNYGPDIVISDERDALLETGGGVMKALRLLGSDPFYVINSDALWVDTGALPLMTSLAAAYDPNEMDILLSVMRIGDAPGYDGVGDLFLNEDTGKITLRGDADTATHMFAGVRILSPDCFNGEAIGCWSMRRLFRKAEKAGRLYGTLYDGTWLHVGDPDALAHANNVITVLEG